MTTNRMGLASDSDIQQIIDSTEKGTTMFVAVHAFYLMAKELKVFREASKVPVAWKKRGMYDAGKWDSVDPEFVKSPDGWHSDYDPLYAAPQLAVMVPDEVTFEQAMLEVHGLSPAEAFQKAWSACRATILQGADGNSLVIPDWQAEAEKMAELYGSSFVVFRNGESPQCSDPSKVIISFTDEGLGRGAAAPQQEVKSG